MKAADVELANRYLDELLALPPEDAQAVLRACTPAQRKIIDRTIGERRRPVYVNDPGLWVSEVLGETLWSAQRDIGALLVEHKRVAVPAAVSMGKSFFAARLVCWWIDTHPPGDAFVVTTAATGSQVKAILWREISRAAAILRANGRFIRTNQTEMYVPVDDEGQQVEELVAFGRKPADSNSSVGLQGIHAPAVLLIIDEAGGVPASLYQAGERITVSDASRTLAIGNPMEPNSHFARICRPGSGWKVRAIDAHDSPNFTDEHLSLPKDICDQLQTTTWAADQLKMYGEDSAQYQGGVRGRFPKATGVNLVMPTDALERASAEDRAEPTVAPDLGVRLGVDVGGGGDTTVVREMIPTTDGGWILGRRWHGITPESEQVIALVSGAVGEVVADGDRVDVVNVDSVGIGWAVVGWLQAEGIPAVAVNAGATAVDSARFENVRAELWWSGREALSDDQLDLVGAEDLLLEELADARWRRSARGKVIVEPKDEMRKRLGRSPDDADALLLAIYHSGGGPPVAPVEVLANLGKAKF